jgi:hypothetical protein
VPNSRTCKYKISLPFFQCKNIKKKKLRNIIFVLHSGEIIFKILVGTPYQKTHITSILMIPTILHLLLLIQEGDCKLAQKTPSSSTVFQYSITYSLFSGQDNIHH